MNGELVKKIAVFASGRGSNFQKIYANIERGVIPARVQCLITDNEQAGAIDFAREHAIPVHTVKPKDFPSPQQFGNRLLEILRDHQVEWVILAGYLKKIPENVVSAYSNRIVNIHPALLPFFGGKGMYGMHVHRAVFESGMKVSGVTVHLVNNEYDAGPIVMQRAVDISECRTPEEIAACVLQVEHQLYSEALQKLFARSFEIINNRVVFQSP